MRNKWIYIIYDIKSLLIRELERFYLLLVHTIEFFHNYLYLILYNKKIIIYLFLKYFYQIKMINY